MSLRLEIRGLVFMDDLSMGLVLFGQPFCLLETANMPVFMI